MHLLFDYQAFEMQRIGGVSRSYAETISSLKGLGIICTLGLKESDNVYLDPTKVKPLHYYHNLYFCGRRWIKGQRTITRKIASHLGYHNDLLSFNKDYCIHLLEKGRFDIFEPTFFDSYFLPYLKGKPFTMEVHDMIPELFPQYFARDDFQIRQKRLLCTQAAAIHVPSQCTKEDLAHLLGVPPEKVTVISHGTPSIPYTNAPPPIEYPYLLYVGDRYGYKNFDALLDEFHIIAQQALNLQLLCTGKPFTCDEQRRFAELGLTGRIHHLFADDSNFYALYHHAEAFVYPSAYEGFGLPILEAFQCGCPVMLNNASCFPEVAGDAAIYFDIKQRGALADCVLRMLLLPKQDREALIAKGTERLSHFSWERSAQILAELYHRAT